ncbi:homoserine O-acetyltransferase [Branchiibius hedensis]|uniref:Homoserine O-acetyltransferase n=1 Tax=Branchiibius hedensis TaxID=672460 RepID=A0A2Y9BT71_9MICO|nr:homoserine O-acetyltransferase [Branchiibius hedensis]PWJ24725.1 homoserine O-acetyltransferase [Branchiibius hedensis]SSA33542.1 homoserine O-acetyltransferase [Branchiibius hedensis]
MTVVESRIAQAPARPQARRVPTPPGANPRAHAIGVPAFVTETGERIPDLVITFQTWGTLSPAADNAILIEHALTGDAHVVGPTGPDQPTPGWWPGIIGPGAPLDTDTSFVVAVNAVGGCRGTTGPHTLAPDGRAWGSRFPRTTIRDQVSAEAIVADYLGIDRWQLVLGGSMGGMRAIEWVGSFPERTGAALVIASTPWATADQIAWGHMQSVAIESDPAWHGGDYYATGHTPDTGLGLARRIAHNTYRSAAELDDRFGLTPQTSHRPLDGGQFAVQSYLDHQAAKLVRRFDAGSYLNLTRAMATHDVTRDRGDLADVLGGYDGLLRVVAVDSDRLFPPALSEAMVAAYGREPLLTIASDHGHDGFLIEHDQIATITADVVADTRPLGGAVG